MMSKYLTKSQTEPATRLQSTETLASLISFITEILANRSCSINADLFPSISSPKQLTISLFLSSTIKVFNFLIFRHRTFFLHTQILSLLINRYLTHKITSYNGNLT